MNPLSPLDGRYAAQVEDLARCFSEQALVQARLEVEVEWLLHLAALPEIGELEPVDDKLAATVRGWVTAFDDQAMARVKAIEARTNHDVKAVEYFFKERLADVGFGPGAEFVHFACTSEDINNLAYALMIRRGLDRAWYPVAEALVDAVGERARAWAAQPMLAHTHGQPATPTTLGKELAVFVARWRRQLTAMHGVEFLGKFSGAVGTFGAHVVAYPEVDWPAVSRQFVERFGLTWNPLTTQIESHDYLAELLHALVRFNTIVLDFCRDMWSYISLGYLRQRTVAGEVGSSTMPHKVNPIDFENAEANLGLSNALLEHLATKLMVSRLQRDLSDSSALRNVGVAVGYSGLALRAAARGLGRVAPDPDTLAADLDDQWEVLGEAIQTVMRRYGLPEPYERLKDLTRGTTVGAEDVRRFVAGLGLPPDAEARLLKLEPAAYTGLAEQLVGYAEGPSGGPSS